MARTKNTARKGSGGLPPARFPQVAPGAGKKLRHYQARNQLPVKAVPSTAAEADSTADWTQLSPSLLEGAAPPLERVVSQLNAEFEQAPSQEMEELADLVQDLHDNPPAPSVLPTTSQVLMPMVTSETVAETPVQPLLLTKQAVAGLAPTKARPKPPTAAAKCPRKEFRERQKPVPRRKQKPSSLTSLQEIRKYQTECKPFPSLPPIYQSSEGHSEWTGPLQDLTRSSAGPQRSHRGPPGTCVWGIKSSLHAQRPVHSSSKGHLFVSPLKWGWGLPWDRTPLPGGQGAWLAEIQKRKADSSWSYSAGHWKRKENPSPAEETQEACPGSVLSSLCVILYCIVLYFNCIALYVYKSRNSPLQCEAHIQNLNWQGGAMYFCACNFVPVIIPAFIHFCYHFTFLSSHLLWCF